jgi:4-amino-4-deoxy-L-arabinose transferase-like glycosyltransferase
MRLNWVKKLPSTSWMRNKLYKHKLLIILLTLILIGGFFRAYDLNWGAPYYFHPDERNIASSVTQIVYPSQFNPHFFAYGSLPIYTIYFTGLFVHFFQPTYSNMLTFAEAIIISRLYSTLFSILLIPLIFLIGKELKDSTTGIIAAFLTTFSLGLIQFAHFGTFEMWLTFWMTVLFYACLRYYKTASKTWVITIGVVFGILCAVKISSVALFPLALLTLLLDLGSHHKRSTLHKLINLIIAGILACGTYLLTNPFALLDFDSFLGSMRYESGVATGALPVFYTGEFVNTIPILYPLISIYPFIINPLITLLFVPAFCYAIFFVYKTKNIAILLLIIIFLLLFFSQAFLYVQWTRYYAPTVPFILLTIALSCSSLLQSKHKRIAAVGIGSLFLYTTLHATAFIITTYVEEDTRLQAVAFAKKHIGPDERIVSEVYDLGILPFNENFDSITLYDFYSLDDPLAPHTPALPNASYILSPSQRIVKVRLQNPDIYPQGNAFYQSLIVGNIGYNKIYQTPCSIWCKILYFNNPMYAFEGTASVFDRPIVTIFQKR